MSESYSILGTSEDYSISGAINAFAQTPSDDNGEIVNNNQQIPTYGAIILPFSTDDLLKTATVQNTDSITNNFKGKVVSALKKAGQGIKNGITHPVQTIKDITKYMTDNRQQVSGVLTTVGSKFSGIAVTQAIMDGKVTSKEALDYLFMGFAPALGVQGSLMGYSGLNQMKDALSNGSINVGEFISGFTRTLRGVTDFADMMTGKNTNINKDVILFDLTISHNETYQSETPDRRVQNGTSLNEYIHNLPETFSVNCSLQEGKRYSKAEYRTIITQIRTQKIIVSLVLGDEMFDNLMVTDFEPTHDCTKSGMDYVLSFKKIYRADIDTKTEVTIQKLPQVYEDASTISSGSVSGIAGVSGIKVPDVKIPAYTPPKLANIDLWEKRIARYVRGESLLEVLGYDSSREEFYSYHGKSTPRSNFQKIINQYNL